MTRRLTLWATRTIFEDELLPRVGARGSLQRLLEPDVVVTTVVRNDVDNDSDAHFLELLAHLVKLGESADARVDVPVVRNIVCVSALAEKPDWTKLTASIFQRRGVERAQPDRVHAQLLQVVHLRYDTLEVSYAVAVRVTEGARVDLVD